MRKAITQSISFSEEILQKIDNYAKESGYTRSKAIRELVEIALITKDLVKKDGYQLK